MFKIFTLGLIDQHIAVGQEKDALLPSIFPEAINNLKRRISFTGTRSHHQQYPVWPAADGFHGSIDRDLLIVARGASGSVEKVIEGGDSSVPAFLFFYTSCTFPKIQPVRESFPKKVLAPSAGKSGTVMHNKTITVRT